jgi:hypothetical protein
MNKAGLTASLPNEWRRKVAIFHHMTENAMLSAGFQKGMHHSNLVAYDLPTAAQQESSSCPSIKRMALTHLRQR